jgi:hypothetical protein
LKSLTSLAEFLDMLMTHASIALQAVPGSWDITIRPDSDLVRLRHLSNQQWLEQTWTISQINNQGEHITAEHISANLDHTLEEFVRKARSNAGAI